MRRFILLFTFLFGFVFANEEKPMLEVLSWRCSFNSVGFVVVEGRVKNISDTILERVRPLAELDDSDGEFITSDWTFLEIESLKPEETSPFRLLIVNTGPEPATATLRFLDKDRATMPATIRIEVTACTLEG